MSFVYGYKWYLTLRADIIFEGATISVCPHALESTPKPSNMRLKYSKPVKP